MPGLYRLLRPLLYCVPPETGHRLAIAALKYGLFPTAAQPFEPSLQVKLCGLTFPNPLGVAAGFDKDIEAPDALLRLGFGFAEVGSITPLPQPGNPKPRLFRLEADRALINRLGFNSGGHANAVSRLRSRAGRPGIIGVNIGANKESSDIVADYVQGLTCFNDIASYIAINISSPNTPGLRGLQSKAELRHLLERIGEARSELHRPKPLLLKIAPDLSDAELDDIAGLVIAHSIDGVIVSNTTVSRPALKSPRASEPGGLSGAPLFELSTRKLARLYRLTSGRLPLIGVGGVTCAETAWQKLRAGASLIQLYSALVYEGPSLARTICGGLAERLAASAKKSISEITGTGVSDWL
jgi:dihydroorotate dehydrogenase